MLVKIVNNHLLHQYLNRKRIFILKSDRHVLHYSQEVNMTKIRNPEIPGVPKCRSDSYPGNHPLDRLRVIHGEWLRVRILTADREGLPSDQGFHLLSFHKQTRAV